MSAIEPADTEAADLAEVPEFDLSCLCDDLEERTEVRSTTPIAPGP